MPPLERRSTEKHTKGQSICSFAAAPSCKTRDKERSIPSRPVERRDVKKIHFEKYHPTKENLGDQHILRNKKILPITPPTPPCGFPAHPLLSSELSILKRDVRSVRGPTLVAVPAVPSRGWIGRRPRGTAKPHGTSSMLRRSGLCQEPLLPKEVIIPSIHIDIHGMSRPYKRSLKEAVMATR